MPTGTPFHTRTLALCESLNYREWAGYYAPSAYESAHEHEYHAIRHAAAIIDISPLFKYVLSGRDALRLIDRLVTRDATRLAPGHVMYTTWCDEHGAVIDDGTIARLEEDRYRWTAADPNLRWIVQQAAGLDVEIADMSERTAALAVQGPMSAALVARAADADVAALRYFHVTAGTIAGCRVDISRTGYTGDLGYEIWIDRGDALAVWDAIMAAGRDYAAAPAGLLALDLARIEAGLLLTDVDFFSVRKALTASQRYSPYEMGLDRLVDLHKPAFVGRGALAAERQRGTGRRVVGLTIEWADVEALHDAVGLPPVAPAAPSRAAVPVFAGHRQIGRLTSSAWSPILKRLIGLATVDAPFAGPGSEIEVEYTVDAVRHRVRARVTPTPFFHPARKTATPPEALMLADAPVAG